MFEKHKIRYILRIMNILIPDIKLPEPWLVFQRLVFPDPYLTKAHRHPAWQLSASLEGTFFYHMEKETVLQKPGEWILIPPELVHDCGSDSPRSEAVQIFFHRFPPDLFPEPAKIFNLFRGAVRCGKIPLRELESLAERIRKEQRNGGVFRTSALRLLCLDFVMLCLSGMRDSDLPEAEIRPELLRALEFMEHHYAEPLGVPDFAAEAGLSVRAFSELFRTALKTSPMQFFNSIRLAHAQELLLKGESILRTSQLCGFSSPQYFCRCFREASGTTPGQFRVNPFQADEK